MKWKLEIANVRANERLLLKEHLDQMSERGWDLKRIGSFYLLYERAVDPCSWHIGFNDDAAMLNAPRYIGISAQKQIDLYEEMGYTFVTAFRCLMIIALALQNQRCADRGRSRKRHCGGTLLCLCPMRAPPSASPSRFASLLPASCC
ncbi:MAG: hypothetical protein ACLVJ6_16615 [Merdibacter sp.]